MPEKGLEEKEEIEADDDWKRKLNKFLNEDFKWLIILAIFSVLISGFFFLVLPKYIQTTTYMDMVKEQEKIDFQAKTEELKRIKQLLSAYAGIDKQYIEKVSAIAPIKKNKEELFPEIRYLVDKNQLFLQSMSLGDISIYKDEKIIPTSAAQKKLTENIGVVRIELFVRGTDYEAFKNFLSTLENNLRLMDVVSVNFDPVGKTTSLIINTYYVNQ